MQISTESASHVYLHFGSERLCIRVRSVDSDFFANAIISGKLIRLRNIARKLRNVVCSLADVVEQNVSDSDLTSKYAIKALLCILIMF